MRNGGERGFMGLGLLGLLVVVMLGVYFFYYGPLSSPGANQKSQMQNDINDVQMAKGVQGMQDARNKQVDDMLKQE
jgi:hypothetical protein